RGLFTFVRLERPLLQLLQQTVRHWPGLEVRMVDPQLVDVAVVADHELERDLRGEARISARLLSEATEERLLVRRDDRVDAIPVELRHLHSVRISCRSGHLAPGRAGRGRGASRSAGAP